MQPELWDSNFGLLYSRRLCYDPNAPYGIQFAFLQPGSCVLSAELTEPVHKTLYRNLEGDNGDVHSLFLYWESCRFWL